MTKQKGLQKFTDFEKAVSSDDFSMLQKENPKNIDLLHDYFIERINQVANNPVKKEGELDKYFIRAMRLMEFKNDEKNIKGLKRERWYINELLINQCINNSITNFRLVPSTSDIAQNTGLSRQTVQKHLKERRCDDFYIEQTETLRGMTHSVLCQLYKIGIEGSNVKALKVFLDYFKETEPPRSTKIDTQNNYIQINGLTISQEQIQKLSVDKMGKLQDFLKTISLDNLQ